MTDVGVRGAGLLLCVMFSADASSAPAEIAVRVHAGRVSVHVLDAPLHDVLDQIAAKTGMRVIYDGPPPQGIVELTLDDQAPVAVVNRMLEGRGLKYAMALDRAGMCVRTLVISAGHVGQMPAPAPPSPTEIPIVIEDFELPENPPDTVFPESVSDRDPHAP